MVKETNVRVTFSMNRDIKNDLEAIAEENGTSMSFIVETLANKFIKTYRESGQSLRSVIEGSIRK